MADKQLDIMIKAIKDNVGVVDQVDFLKAGDKYSELKETCKKFLVYVGYKVVDPVQYQIIVKKQDDLINFFYTLLAYYHPEWLSKRNSTGQDRAMAKQFVEVRMTTGISKQIALNECAEIIETVFKHENEFHFKYPLSFSIFGQKKLGWVTDYAMQIINKKRTEANIRAEEESRKKVEDSYENEVMGFIDLDDVLKKVRENT